VDAPLAHTPANFVQNVVFGKLEPNPSCVPNLKLLASTVAEIHIIIIIIISGFGIYGAAVVPDSGVGNTWQRLTLVLHEFLSNGLTPSRLHIVISFLTHADHVFLGLPRSLVPGSPKRVMELMHEVARCTCPYHLRRRVQRTAMISSR